MDPSNGPSKYYLTVGNSFRVASWPEGGKPRVASTVVGVVLERVAPAGGEFLADSFV